MSQGKDGLGPERQPIRVFLLDDYEIVRLGIRDLLNAEPDITVVGEAGSASAALSLIPVLMPDVAILDVRLADGDGVSVCREVRSKVPEVGCLMLTAFDDDEALFEAIMAGAAGYVLKRIRGMDLAGAVRAVAAGRSLLDHDAANRVKQRMRERAVRADPLRALSHQEKTVLKLIGEGLTNRQIGERLGIAEKTVKNYVSSVYNKLGMQRRTQAAALATKVFPEESPASDETGAPPAATGHPVGLTIVARAHP
jgi:DNA-binding NarL/FixJ family response regulator